MRPISSVANYDMSYDTMFAYTDAVRSMPESIEEAKILTDVAGRIQYLNLAAEQLIGISFEETRGRPLNVRGLPHTKFFNLIDESSQQSLNQMLAECVANDETITLSNSVALVDTGGAHIPIGGSISPMRIEGFGTIGAIMAFRDATATRHMMGQIFDLDLDRLTR